MEIIDLDEVEQAQLMVEIARAARALKDVTQCDKLNIAALGNAVPQLHVHMIARRTATRPGRSRSGARCRRSRTIAAELERFMQRDPQEEWLIERSRMPVIHARQAALLLRPDLGPAPRLGYVDSVLERAAERRTDRKLSRCCASTQPMPASI